MKRSMLGTGYRLLVLIGVLVLIVVMACAPRPAPTSTPTPAPTPAATPSPTSTPVPTTPAPTPSPIPTATSTPVVQFTVKIASKADLGNYLVDGKGMTLYYWTKDVPGKSNATAAVLQAWPIFIPASFVVQSPLNAADFGTITRDDGAKQATYKNWPLYYYVKDQAPGDTTGQGVGGVWFVINPDKFPPTPTPTPVASPSLSPTATATAAPSPTPTATATSAPTVSPTPAGTTAPAPQLTVKIASNASLGNYLADGKGMTLYYWKNDVPGKSNATAAVLQAWPIFIPASFVVQSPLSAADFGTITRDDGAKQATYKNWPLYYYVKDQAPGDAVGQGVGGVWFVIDPAKFPPAP